MNFPNIKIANIFYSVFMCDCAYTLLNRPHNSHILIFNYNLFTILYLKHYLTNIIMFCLLKYIVFPNINILDSVFVCDFVCDIHSLTDVSIATHTHAQTIRDMYQFKTVTFLQITLCMQDFSHSVLSFPCFLHLPHAPDLHFTQILLNPLLSLRLSLSLSSCRT